MPPPPSKPSRRSPSSCAASIRTDPGAAGRFLHDAYFAQTDLQLVQGAVTDQRGTVSIPPTLSQRQFQQNIDFEMKFDQDVKQVVYEAVINSRWLPS